MLSMSTLPYPSIPSREWRKKHNKMFNIKEMALDQDLMLDQWIVPSGTMVKIWQTQNFGWVKVPKDCQDKRGFTMPRTLFNY